MKKRELLESERVKREMSRKQVADFLKITESYYGMIEKGSRCPTLGLAQKIAKLFNQSVENLFCENSATVGCSDTNKAAWQ